MKTVNLIVQAGIFGIGALGTPVRISLKSCVLDCIVIILLWDPFLIIPKEMALHSHLLHLT